MKSPDRLLRPFLLTAIAFTLTGSDVLPQPPYRRHLPSIHQAPIPEQIDPSHHLDAALSDFITQYSTTCRFILQDPLNNHVLINHRENELFHPASTTKMLIAYSVVQAAVSGDIDLHKPLEITPSDMVGGSGIGLQPGSYSTEQLLALMLQKSDNTASNVIRKAYLPYLNKTILALELQATHIDRGYFLPDSTGQLVTSSQDLVKLYQSIYTFLNQNSHTVPAQKFYDWIISRDIQLLKGTTVGKYGELDGLLSEAGIYYGQHTALIYSLSCDSQDRTPFDKLSHILGRVNNQPLTPPLISSPYSSP